jgi:hypothetical protein
MFQRDKALRNHIAVSEVASEMKKILKALPGSNFMQDRRGE